MPPEVAFEAFKNGKAVIVDVREPAEWQGGVAEPAELLPLSDLNGARTAVEALPRGETKDKQIFLYCRSGNRSGQAAGTLQARGLQRGQPRRLFHLRPAAACPTRKPRKRR